MDKNFDKIRFASRFALSKSFGGSGSWQETAFWRVITFSLVVLVWELAARSYNSVLVMPHPFMVLQAFFEALVNAEVLNNLALTLGRVLFGLCIAVGIGCTLGFIMGSSPLAMKLIDPLLNPLRQVPVMAWVPLAIVWFGLGEGPTIFLIALVSTFPVLLSTVAGVHGIDRNFYNAARSMGASRWTIMRRVTVPGALPDILTGMRVAVSSGWMSVI